jgi:pilus assembly protein CpaE
MNREQSRPTTVLAEPAPVNTAARDFEEPNAATLRVAIAGSDRASNSLLSEMLEATGSAKEIHEWAWIHSIKLHVQDVPDVVFLDLAAGMGSEFEFAQELNKLKPSVHIIACSLKHETNSEFLLQAMRSGIRDFLQKPYNRLEIGLLMRRLSEESGARLEKKAATGRLFVVLGTKGGVGTSTVAVNLAVQLAQRRSKRTLLLDFSRPMGDVAALLDLKPTFQVRDAVENVKRLDSALLEGLLTTHKSGLKVLAGAMRLEDWQGASPVMIERILEVAQRDFDAVVVDFGSFYSPEWRNVLQSSEVLLISEADLPGLAKLHKHLSALANLRVAAKNVHLVINRWHRQDEEALAQIENQVKMPVFARLPNNFKQVNEATVRGVPVAKNGDPLTAGFEAMAERLAGTEKAGERKKSRLGQFLSR